MNLQANERQVGAGAGLLGGVVAWLAFAGAEILLLALLPLAAGAGYVWADHLSSLHGGKDESR